ncbi:protein of unknown function [Sterolibacterium denitrificans]|uniref:Uncharacterized protein n=2 Tax=Sterolibacterium denitrificans TaxID=157592 RepID=A0A7Z7MV77_9PROT|nr:protein of unknown function [Sterolibacterium denitrificans]
MNESNGTSDRSDMLLDQADALMRRRNFVSSLDLAEAKSAQPAGTPAEEETLSLDSQDVPVLTEVIEAEVTASPATASDATAAAMRQIHQQKICKTLESWLEEVLPQMLANTMNGLSEQLLAELRERARAELPARLKPDLSE